MFRVQAKNPQELAAAVYKLIAENIDIFDAQKHAIDILDTPVRYRKEPLGKNEFLNFRDMMKIGYGDCEDLAAALIAYFLLIGYEARPSLTLTGNRMYHVTVDVFYDGTWQNLDPSKLKGMK